MSGNALGYASACQIDLNTNRPIAGYLNINPTLFEDYSTKEKTIMFNFYYFILFI